MVVLTVPHIPSPPPQYDGPHGYFPRRQSVPVMGNRKGRLPRLPAFPAEPKPAPARQKPLIVNGSTNTPVTKHGTGAAAQPDSPVVEDHDGGFGKALIAAISAKLCASEPATPAAAITQVAPAPIPILAPVPIPVNATGQLLTKPQQPLKPAPESGKVHIYLAHLPHDNKLNAIRLRANYTAVANKPELVAAARAVILAALHSIPATKDVYLGSWFSWSECGVNINFQTHEQRWLATDNQAWLSVIGEKLRISEKWAGIVIRNIWNPYIISHTHFDDAFMRRLESLNAFQTRTGADGEPVNEEYRVRKVRWFKSGVMAIWFHDARVAEHFLEKRLWFMDGLLGRPAKMGVCTLTSIWPLHDTSRRRFPGGGVDLPRKFDGQDGAMQHRGNGQGGGQWNGCADCGKLRGGYREHRPHWQRQRE
ncbi:hypothetical protein Dda_1702 [Drechslerella dactyloides]|uniref:Uncharacterized protein n=1 Tax=Drechslerella dactyloides TaxID=74499 RepID=A0AAD6J6J8_DREDA|nr:hypothetical protein Dda_1702 [Drechslerella dactyloides]